MNRFKSSHAALVVSIIGGIGFIFCPHQTLSNDTLMLSGLSLQSDTVAQHQWDSADRSIWSDIGTSVGCVGHVVTSPLRWNGTDWLTAGGVTAGVAASFLLDDEARDLMVRNHSSFADNFSDLGNTYGTVLYVGPTVVAVYLAGAALKDRGLRNTGQMLIEAVITTGIIQLPLSIAVGRARPFFNEGNTSFKFFAGTTNDRASFFSGHAMVAFSISTILSHQINNGWVTAGLYTLAALCPYARLYKDKHWLSDTALGGALGVAVGNSIWHYHNDSSHGDTAGLSFAPTGSGLSVSWRF